MDLSSYFKILNEKKYNDIIKKKYLKYKKQMNTDF